MNMRISQFRDKLVSLGIPTYHNWVTRQNTTYLVWTIAPQTTFQASNRSKSRVIQIIIDLFDYNEYNKIDAQLFQLFDTDESTIELETIDFEYKEKGKNLTHYVYNIQFCLEGGLDG